MKKTNHGKLAKKVSLMIVLTILLAMGISQAFTQQDRQSPRVPDNVMAELIKMHGKLISEGRNRQPVGPLKLISYRLEELTLPQSVTVEINQKATQVNKAWRLTITGGPFPVRALPAVIWVDDVPLGSGVENERLSEISVITFDQTLLREGGVIALSYGENKESRLQLPEKLSTR
ncbi:MAG TPA: hypothetical protein VGP81_11380 [Pyrinomonadaceae bacterium]|jgi:hypothetical protein|nr:hypothetical protein [Pyrinomonadaceae bacterium]